MESDVITAKAECIRTKNIVAGTLPIRSMRNTDSDLEENTTRLMIICGWRLRDNMDPNKSKITNRRISFSKVGEQEPFYTQELDDVDGAFGCQATPGEAIRLLMDEFYKVIKQSAKEKGISDFELEHMYQRGFTDGYYSAIRIVSDYRDSFMNKYTGLWTRRKRNDRK